MTDYVVFFRSMSEAQRNELNSPGGGWSSPLGSAYLACDPDLGDVAPAYAGAIEFDLFEMAALVRDCADKNELWRRMQNRGPSWTCEPTVRAFTDFPRSMSKGDVVYDADLGEWSYVATGFEPVTDEAFIEYLHAKLMARSPEPGMAR